MFDPKIFSRKIFFFFVVVLVRNEMAGVMDEKMVIMVEIVR
jgi:hypothetical protein